MQAGFAEGVAEAAAAGRSIRIGTLITAMRHADRGDEIAALALENRDNGVVGFDIAGAEDGFPPSRHATAFTTLARGRLPRHRARRRGGRRRVDRGGRARGARVPDRARRAAHRGRHHRRARRPAGHARPLDPRPAHPARAVPVVERADRAPPSRWPRTPSRACGTSASPSRSTPTTGCSRGTSHDPRADAAGRGGRLGRSSTCATWRSPPRRTRSCTTTSGPRSSTRSSARRTRPRGADATAPDRQDAGDAPTSRRRASDACAARGRSSTGA